MTDINNFIPSFADFMIHCKESDIEHDLLIYIFTNKPRIYEKKLSLFFGECGYDGFNYDDYEYIIFNPNNLKILSHYKIR